MATAITTRDPAEFEQCLQALFGNISMAFGEESGSANRSFSSGLLGDCRLTRIEADPNIVVNAARPCGSDSHDHIKVILQQQGASILQQEGRSIPIGRDHIAIYDPTRPFVLNNVTAVRHFVLQIPRQALSAAMLGKLSEPYSVTESNAGMRSVLLSMMSSTLDQFDDINVSSRNSVGQVMIDVVRTLLIDSSRKRKSREEYLDILRRQIINFILDNIDNADLDAKMIAANLRCCVRYVYRAFEQEHDSLGRFIWNQRLDAAASKLRNASHHAGEISAVAFETGFCSSAHFSRAFRRRFGLSPSEWRKLHGRRSAPRAARRAD